MSATTSKPTDHHKEYVLGTNEAEAARLGLQHQLWSAFAHETWELAGIGPGSTVLDVGCGPGFGSFDLARLVGTTGMVHAVDESAAYIERLRAEAERRGIRNITAHVGDVQQLEKLPIKAGSIDAAFERWVMCFVADPEAVVRGVSGLLRVGGVFAVNDYFNYESMTLAPREPAFSRVIAAVGKSWRDRGGDPDVVGRLPGLLAKHGLKVEDLSVAQRIARTPAWGAGSSATMWAWPDSFFRLFVPSLVEMGYLTARDQEEFLEMWERVTRDAGIFMALPPVWRVVGMKK
ncbi:MAG TPA: methyltransferase domain-containing protein [Phycisphaerales bacterium]|nr:methyltransferase domain-containing protein [Phycisphaerales bacterium]